MSEINESIVKASQQIDPEELAKIFYELARLIAPAVNKAVNAVRKAYEENEDTIKSSLLIVSEAIKSYHTHKQLVENIESSGFVPHRVLYDLSCEELMFFHKEFSDQLVILKNKSDFISSQLLETYPRSQLGEQRMDLFGEIIKAHQIGLYNISVRCALIEIEGLAYDFFERFQLDNRVNNRKNIIKKWRNTDFSSGSNDLDDFFIIRAFELFVDQLHWSSDIQKFKDDVKPWQMALTRNTHAHGIILPLTPRDSLNAIFLLHNFSQYFSRLIDIRKTSD